MSKIPRQVGLIAEDESDIESIKELFRRITNKQNIGFKGFIGRGCGKIKRKSDDWAKQLKNRGCKILVLIHDSDTNDPKSIYEMIFENLNPFVIKDTFISIPIQEMEAWFLADPKGIKTALNLQKETRNFFHPETINSPKEVLSQQVQRASNNTKIYLNTKHNPLIAKHVDIEVLKSKCPSFNKLCSFILAVI